VNGPHDAGRESGPAMTKEQAMTTTHRMQLGMVGLGRMGANLVRRLIRDGHSCVVFDIDAAVKAWEKEGATAAGSVADLVAELSVPGGMGYGAPPVTSLPGASKTWRRTRPRYGDGTSVSGTRERLRPAEKSEITALWRVRPPGGVRDRGVKSCSRREGRC
jgi:hypothetical protein